MSDLRVEGFNFTPIENYNKFLNSNTNFGVNNTSDFEKILFEKRLALETPGKTLKGGVEMLDFDKVIEDTYYKQKKEKTGLVNELSGSLKSGLISVNNRMVTAEKAQEAFAAGEDVSVHDLMIAAEKAHSSFQMAMQLRNKLISAYTEINNVKV